MFSDNIRKLHKIEIDDHSYKKIIKSETRYINIGKKKCSVGDQGAAKQKTKILCVIL